MKPRIHFYSTHPWYPYWGGSEKYWHETVLDDRFRKAFECRVTLKESHATKTVGKNLQSLEVDIDWEYRPNLIARVSQRLLRQMGSYRQRKLWFKRLNGSKRPNLVWFNLAAAEDVFGIYEAAKLCQEHKIPYWLVFQQVPEHFFPIDEDYAERFLSIVASAKRLVFIAQRNHSVIEKSLGRHLSKIWMGANALPQDLISQGHEVSLSNPVRLDGPVTLLHLARIDLQHKGQHILLEVLSDKSWKDREWRLIFQGGGNHHRLLHRLVDYFGIAHERVEIRHHNPDVLKVIGESDLLVMPSIVEGMPFALLEGMAGGRAAVAAPVAGIPEVVRTGETGWLARSTDPADFNDALNSAWCERHRWQELGSAAQALVARKFNQQSTIGTIIEALNDDLV